MTNPTEYRLRNLRKQFLSWDVEAILIESPTNRRWLSGFTGSSGRLLITHQQAILATDSRYWQQASIEAPDFELFQDQRRHEDTISMIRSANVQRIGIEANHITLSNADRLRSIIDLSWVPLEKPVEPLRHIKSASEIEHIRTAATIADQAMELVPQLVHPGMTERTLAWKLERTMRENGADGLAFPIIVAFGPNSALPHHHPGDRQLQVGEIVLVDMGAEVNGYRSDLTRTFFFGSKLDHQFSVVYDLVHAALESSASKLRPGVNTQEAHKYAMDVISAGGHGKDFPHGLGHNVGLDIHEEPFLSDLRPAEEITEGMIITIEPGIYLPGWGGVRIEDLVIVIETGVETISKCPKVPLIRI